ncbi:MAG: GNAT family N-acetyltransferase [Bacillota bacterium]|nr:GNAT family N-acetyltransferase [Bacillota bacterium]
MLTDYEFRQINISESEQASAIEHVCFPPNEADGPEVMDRRIKALSHLFFVAIDRKTGKLAGYINGISTNEGKFRDEFFTNETLNNDAGVNIMLVGIAVLPQYQHKGLAEELVRRYKELMKAAGKKRLILTCHDTKVPMYSKWGFADLGMADSTWGGDVWHEMCCEL